MKFHCRLRQSCSVLIWTALVLSPVGCNAPVPVEASDAESIATASMARDADVHPIPAPSIPEQPAPRADEQLDTTWQYRTMNTENGNVVRAEITSVSGAERLVFEAHPISGRDARIELSTDVDCPTGCKVRVRRDGSPTEEILASRPENPHVRLTLDEPRALWNSLRGVRAIEIEYSAKSGPITTQFTVAGMDATKLAGWEE